MKNKDYSFIQKQMKFHLISKIVEKWSIMIVIKIGWANLSK